MHYVAQPLSRLDMRRYAYQIRTSLELTSIIKLPVVRILEAFHLIMGDDDFWWEVVDDDFFSSGKHAEYDLTENCIRISNSTYLRACAGHGRDRMTIVHEMSHAFLFKVFGVQFGRSFSDAPIRTCEDPEWQAKCLAGELMMPYHQVAGMDYQLAAKICGVSYDAARYQLSKYK